VIDIAEQPLGRLLPAQPAAAIRDALANIGVRWHFGKATQAVERSGEGLVLDLGDGTHIVADAVLSAIGLRPRTELARAAGLAVNRGIAVDKFLRASDAGIHALGDCAEVEGAVLPFVLPIMNAARALAPTLAGAETALRYPAMPVVVKTPALPTVVCPPARGTRAGGRSRPNPAAWSRDLSILRTADRLRPHGTASARRQQMLKEMQSA